MTFLDGGTRKIYVTSSSVTGSQTIAESSTLLGAFHNRNTLSHFYSETPHPQTHARLNKLNLLNVKLYNENHSVINAQNIHHLAVCLIMMKSDARSGFMLSLSGEVRDYGVEQNVVRYICRTTLPRGIRFGENSLIALTDVFLPELIEERAGEVRPVVGDHNGGVIHYTIESDVISTDSDIGSDLLRSFCLKVGERSYTPPFLLYTKLNPGEHREITFVMKVHACSDLLRLLFRGSLEVNISIKHGVTK